jgi:hypothetical protein
MYYGYAPSGIGDHSRFCLSCVVCRPFSGADSGCQVRGAHLKKIASSGINPVIVVRFSAHNVFLKQVSLGTLKVKLFESQLILKLGSKGNQKQGRCNRRAPPKIGKNMIFWRKIVRKKL